MEIPLERYFKIINIPKDGNCLFASLAFGLRKLKGLNIDAASVREEIAEFYTKNLELRLNDGTLEEWMRRSEHCINCYIKKISKNGIWGSHMEIVMASLRFNIKINIWTYNTKISEFTPIETISPKNILGKSKIISELTEKIVEKSINILWNGFDHYDYLDL